MKVQQSLPHYGIKNGYTRKGRNVTTQPEHKKRRLDDDTEITVPAVVRQFDSISQAKRFMRVGS